MKETYEIYKDGHIRAIFYEGDPSHFGQSFDREIALREFSSYVAHYHAEGGRMKCELRISVPGQ